LFITLIESAFNRNLGFDVVASNANIRKDAYWFGEAQSRVVVSVQKDKVEAFKTALGNQAFEELGEVTDGAVEVDGLNWGRITTWKEKYDTAIEQLLSNHAAEHAMTAL
jgi:phosphoribosylformylglycinamidine (FGAM) synthase-like enzyme